MSKRFLTAGRVGGAVVAVGLVGAANSYAEDSRLPSFSPSSELQPIPEGAYVPPAVPVYQPAPAVRAGTTLYNPDGSVTYYPQPRYYAPPYRYYGGPIVGFQRYPYGGSIHLGPLHFGWR